MPQAEPNGPSLGECDILIIGAGTAGCVLANRLSEDPSIRVVLLEAGQNHNDDEKIYTPGLSGQALDDPEYDWCYVSEPQELLEGRRVKHPRGKLLGGSSAINSFSLIYPSAAGFDAWEDLTGDAGWGWESMKGYFRKFQTVNLVDGDVARELGVQAGFGWKGSGPIEASYPLAVSPLHKAWVETFRGLGLESRVDAADGAAIGGYLSANHISDKRERSHAGVAYYEPVRERQNLRLVTGATVHKILFDRTPENGEVTAKGVMYTMDGGQHEMYATKEILLAAGTFGTPQLLELSGIGDENLLRQHGIETVYHNPAVGENLQDHIKAGLSFEPAQVRDALSAEDARKLYEETRTGPWAEKACYTFAYMPLERFLSPDEKQELSANVQTSADQKDLTTFEKLRNTFISKMIFFPTEATTTAYLSNKPGLIPDPGDTSWITLFAMLSHPFSRGSVHIQSPDAFAKPTIDFQYYTHPLDLDIHARHLQVLSKIAKSAPLSTFIKQDGARLTDFSDPLTIDRAKELLKANATSNYHPCGTASMMPESMGGVVDGRLRVYGTRNLRVMDASMIPIIPRGNIVTTVYAVAERAADIMAEDLGLKRTS